MARTPKPLRRKRRRFQHYRRGWFPISTAPKDGTRVSLVCVGVIYYGIENCAWREGRWQNFIEDAKGSEWIDVVDRHFQVDIAFWRPFTPTEPA